MCFCAKAAPRKGSRRFFVAKNPLFADNCAEAPLSCYNQLDRGKREQVSTKNASLISV